MSTIEDIGPILGVVAFLGFAVLALLIVLQAREVRRLREWAGRAPERAAEADDAAQAVADARGEETEKEPGRFDAFRARAAQTWAVRFEELDRRSPVDPRWFLAAAFAAALALGVLTSGFGILGGDDAAPEQAERAAKTEAKPAKVKVAVLNASAFTDGAVPVDPVPGLAATAAQLVVQPTAFKIGVEDEAPEGVERTQIMYEPDFADEAAELANEAREQLGDIDVIEMTDPVRGVVDGASLALLVGSDNSDLGADTASVVP